MPSNEEIKINARNRWKMCQQTEALICEIRSLLNEILVYRTTLQGVRKLLDATVTALRKEGGE